MRIHHIVVPTDLSPVANYATKVAMTIANKVDAHLELYHHTPLLNEYEMVNKLSADMKNQEKLTVKSLEGIRRSYDKELDIETTYDFGNLVAKVVDLSDEKHGQLIVMGMESKDEVEEIFDSKTQKILRMAKCPVLVVKSEVTDFKMDNILFASDFKEDVIPLLKQLQHLSAAWHSTIHLCHIDNDWQDNPTEQEHLKKVLEECQALLGKKLGSSTNFPYMSVPKGINNFSKRIEADVVVIGTHYREYAKIFYKQFTTEHIVNTVEAPILVMKIEKN